VGLTDPLYNTCILGLKPHCIKMASFVDKAATLQEEFDMKG